MKLNFKYDIGEMVIFKNKIGIITAITIFKIGSNYYHNYHILDKQNLQLYETISEE